jgi:hypothetical protein
VLAKVNRVSFGLLSVEDCKQALLLDPHVPRSRLKLGIPFVGKDVPSKASEFAHPDVIIGLTVLAYRYSGLRRDDFTDIVDSLTSHFFQEIGPARDRESSQRHEKWVYAAGGAIRGLKTTRDGHAWVSYYSSFRLACLFYVTADVCVVFRFDVLIYKCLSPCYFAPRWWGLSPPRKSAPQKRWCS